MHDWLCHEENSILYVLPACVNTLKNDNHGVLVLVSFILEGVKVGEILCCAHLCYGLVINAGTSALMNHLVFGNVLCDTQTKHVWCKR